MDKKMVDANNLVWMDLEMTGLDVEQERIIEIATVVTDQNLNVIATGPVLAIHQPSSLLNAMDAWNQKHHTQSGLVERVKVSPYSEALAEKETLAFLKQYVPKGKAPLCGNSIWQDRRFLAKYMPKLEAFFHYRLIDVSTVKELAKRWAPKVYNGYKKECKHLALADILESIEELRHYKTQFFQLPIVE